MSEIQAAEEAFTAAVGDMDPLSDKVQIAQADKINIPTLVFSTDDALIPDQAKKFYSLLQGEKELVWGTGYHFNYYDVYPEMQQAVDAVVPFMKKHLK